MKGLRLFKATDGKWRLSIVDGVGVIQASVKLTEEKVEDLIKQLNEASNRHGAPWGIYHRAK